MKTLLHLVWLAVSLTDIALGYFIVWDWARIHDLAVFIILVGLVNVWWAGSGLHRPKAIRFNHMKGVRYV